MSASLEATDRCRVQRVCWHSAAFASGARARLPERHPVFAGPSGSTLCARTYQRLMAPRIVIRCTLLYAPLRQSFLPIR